MWQAILKFFIAEVVRAVLDAARDAIALKQKQKKDKIEVKKALDVKDPKDRAAAVRDLLS